MLKLDIKIGGAPFKVNCMYIAPELAKIELISTQKGRVPESVYIQSLLNKDGKEIPIHPENLSVVKNICLEEIHKIIGGLNARSNRTT